MLTHPAQQAGKRPHRASMHKRMAWCLGMHKSMAWCLGSCFRQPGSSCKCRAAGMPQGLGLSGVVCRHGAHEQEQPAQRLIASILVRVDHSWWQLAYTRPTVRWVLLLHGMLRLNMQSSVVCIAHRRCCHCPADPRCVKCTDGIFHAAQQCVGPAPADCWACWARVCLITSVHLACL